MSVMVETNIHIGKDNSSLDTGFLFKIALFLSFSLMLSLLSHYLIGGKEWQAYALVSSLFGVYLLFNPKRCFSIFFIAIAIYFPTRIGNFVIQPVDLILALLLFSVLLDFLLNINFKFRPASFDRHFLLLILATAISAVFAFDPSFSILPLLRIVLIYLAFRLFFKFSLEIGIRKMLDYFIYLVTFLSAINILQYFISLGELRVFGSAWLTYESYSMTALPISLAFFLWSLESKERFKYGLFCLVMGMGIIATQSRGPLLAVIITIPVLLFLTNLKALRDKVKLRSNNLRLILIGTLLLGITIIIFKSSMFFGVLERYEEFVSSAEAPQGTVAFRVLQWTAAIEVFKENPITGIGIGNFKLIENIWPVIRLSEHWKYIKDMSVHNVFLQYLAETGIIGAAMLLLLALKGLSVGYKTFKRKLSLKQNQNSAAIFIGLFVFSHTIFYLRDWTWGQTGFILSFLFGVAAAWNYQLKSESQTLS